MATVTGVTAAKMDEIAGNRYADLMYVGDTLYYRRAGSGGYIAVGTFTGPRGPTGSATVNQALVDAAIAPLEPGPWQTIPLISSQVAAYATGNYGIPRYRVERDSIRFEGALEWVAAQRGPIASNPYAWPITQALPAQYQPTYQQSRGVKLKQSGDTWDLRVTQDGSLELIFHTNGTFMATGNVIHLNVVYALS